MAELTIAAMDAEIDVVAYDGRETLEQIRKAYDEEIAAYQATLSASSARQGITVEAYKDGQRHDPLTFVRTSAEKSYDDDNQDGFLWLLGELAWLQTLPTQHPEIPDYTARLQPLEDLIELGHKKIASGKLTSDGLSAVVFSALANKGNRITIGGSAHIDGIGLIQAEPSEYSPEQVHGTFDRQLEAASDSPELHWGAGPPGGARVTAAVLATIADGKEMSIETNKLFLQSCSRAIIDKSLPLLNLDTGTVGEMWHPPEGDERVVTLEDKFPVPEGLDVARREHHIRAHINPLLMPDIARAAEKVRVAVHGPESLARG